MPSEPCAGDVFAGKYRVDRVLGRGGMGMVMAATHVVLGHQVALKFLLPAAAIDGEATARFLREAKVTARLKSVHIARTLDTGQLDDGQPFLVMELLEGRDLGDELESGRTRSVAEVLDWILQACEGIGEAHAGGIVHRDLKPSNLFLARDVSGSETVKVLDFGISKLVTGEDGKLTASHAAFGSPLYMSPEQLRSSKSTDARSDIWSLGVILYEALCGRPPFEGETVFAIAQSIALETPEPLGKRRPDVPPPLAAAILSCLAKKPLDRPQSVADLADALAPFAGPGGRDRAARVRGALDSGWTVQRGASAPPPENREKEWGADTERAAQTRIMRGRARRSRQSQVALAASAAIVLGVGLWLWHAAASSTRASPGASADAIGTSTAPTSSEPLPSVSAPPLQNAAATAASSAGPVPLASSTPSTTTCRPAFGSSAPRSGIKKDPASGSSQAPSPAPAQSSPFIDQRTN